ncbi:hypothetical protein GA830_10670 [Mesorhizobium sp. NBSH29]|uniref:hypothetical protein n=1 Tax=Mesorhizobium sp. NBSH29 TaxID=2654249 RepID=UPI001896A13E|nr:hypothetical protein [Mesorhizobium sp. NBSH29]QPC87154.1 hypothetical protein GA830_10670 [Mesorhizobium sp. NBSH29]
MFGFSWMPLAAGAVAGALAVAAPMRLYDRLIDDPAVFESGRLKGQGEERIAWEELRVRMIRESQVRQKAAQAKIDEVERQYFIDRTGDAMKIITLEEAIKEAENAQTPDRPKPPAFSRGVSRALNPIGRGTP